MALTDLLTLIFILKDYLFEHEIPKNCNKYDNIK